MWLVGRSFGLRIVWLGLSWTWLFEGFGLVGKKFFRPGIQFSGLLQWFSIILIYAIMCSAFTFNFPPIPNQSTGQVRMKDTKIYIFKEKKCEEKEDKNAY